MDLPYIMRRIGVIPAMLVYLIAPHADAAIGRTPGSASVTPDGEAAYTIPLAVPPGTNGMTPAISLEYRHRTQGGLLGVGWTLGGLSQIARCPRTIVQDGIASRVTQTDADRFCLDGQRLVVSNGVAYGAPGAEYRTEIETYSRIRAFAGAGVGPQYFVVEAADGRIFEYGTTPDSRVDGSSAAAHPTIPAWIWALSRVRDRAGNVIDFTYAEDLQNGGFRIVGIRYNSNPGAGVAASHEVAFNYENRPNSEVDTAYVAGRPVRQVVRLTRIDVLYQGAVLRRYELAYEPALTTAGRSRLASVRECGAGGTDCLAPTVFEWQNATAGLGSESGLAATVVNAGYLAESHLWNTADINGDGRSDYVWAGGTSLASATIRYRLGLAGGGFGPEVDTSIACPNGIGVPFDRNGDGRDDLLTIPAARIWTIVPGTDSGLGAPVTTGIPVPMQMADFRGLDLNGDGLGDIAWSEHLDFYSNSLVVRARYGLAGGGFSAAPVTLYVQSEAVGYEMAQGGTFLGRPGQRIDLDGDGTEELLMNEEYTIARISAREFATEYFDGSFYGGVLFDFNGDGCTDFAYKHYTNRLRVRIGGCGLPWSGPELQGPVWTEAAILSALDWNGDGRDDLLLRSATNWRIALSAGDSLPAIADTGIPHSGAEAAVAADANGDGLRDLVTRAGGQFRLRLRSGVKPDLMLAATDGFGVAARYTYQPLTAAGIHVRGTTAIYPEQDMQTAAHVVAKLDVTDGSGTGSVQASVYRYEGLRQHLLGRGMLGFAKVTRTESGTTGSLAVEFTRRQDYPYTGLPQSIVTRRDPDRPVTASAWQWSVLDLGTGAAARRFPYLSSLTTSHYGTGGTHDGNLIATVLRSVSAIDATSGFVTDETTVVTEIAGGASAGALSRLRSVQTGVLNDVSNWCLGRSRGAQVTASHTLAGGAAITRSFSQEWDGPKCRPTERRIEPGDSQWQVIYRLAYDTFGNPAAIGIEGAGTTARTTTIDWGNRGQLPIRIVDPLAQATQLSWDHGPGLLLAMTDPNALTMRWSYDAFGLPSEERQPDGTRTTWTRAACASGCDGRARLRLTQQDRDNADAIHVTTFIDIDQFGRAYRMAAQQPGGGRSVTILDWDAQGRVRRQYRPFWDGGLPPGYWQAEYDLLGRMTSATLFSASGSPERVLALRHDGFSVTRTDALGRTTTATRDTSGRLVQIVDAEGNSTRHEYDPFGNLLKVRDALGNLVADISYNALGMKTRQVDPDMGTWTWTRNALGETTVLRDAKNRDFTFSYDGLGRLTSRVAPDGTSNWLWGSIAGNREIGRLSSMTGPGYRENFTYDAVGRPATRTIVTDTSYAYDYTYNALGLLDTLTYPAAGSIGRLKVGHQYDAGRLTRLTYLDQTGVAVTAWQLNASDAAGNVIDESLGSAVRVVTGFDPLTGAMEYRQSGAGGSSAAQNLAYGWDDNDNLLRRQDLNHGLVEDFSYDALDRLRESRRNGQVNLGLAYDALGNIRWKSDVCAGATPCYTYHATRKHAVTKAGSQAYSYDANGNMTKRAGATIGWTSNNLPKSIVHTDGNSSKFWYGPSGNRWKQVATHAGTSETTIYAGEWMEKVTRGGVKTWRHYLVAPTGVAALQLRYSGSTQPAMRYLTTDHLGSIDRVLDASGNVVVAEGFDAFGQRRLPSGAGSLSATALATLAANTRDGFTGHEHLDNLNLIHMNGRVYDPVIGRFISADPYVPAPFDGQSLNRYAYVWNNPLAYVDPSGFDGEPPCMQTQQGRCAQITVIGATWAQYMRFVGGAGFSQMESGSQRNPCGQESSALTCAMQSGRLTSPASIVLTAGNQTDPTLARGNSVDWLQGAAARLGNLAIGSSPVAMLFGADPDFEWFDVPDSASGITGAAFGDIGYLAGGIAGIVRKGGSELMGATPSQIARSMQGTTKYPGVDRFKDIVLKKGTILYAGYPGQTAFYTTQSALRRSGWSAGALFQGVQIKRHRDLGYRSHVAAYEVVADTPAAFGLAIANVEYGAGWLPQVVVPSYQTSLKFLRELPIGP